VKIINQHYLRAPLRTAANHRTLFHHAALSAFCAYRASWHQQAKNDNEKMKASAAASNGEIMAAKWHQRGGSVAAYE
jgi:hypothetical protein